MYLRIRVDGKTIYLQDAEEMILVGQLCIKGSQCNREGELTTNRDGVFIDHIIAKSRITKITEVHYNKHYGILE